VRCVWRCRVARCWYGAEIRLCFGFGRDVVGNSVRSVGDAPTQQVGLACSYYGADVFMEKVGYVFGSYA